MKKTSVYVLTEFCHQRIRAHAMIIVLYLQANDDWLIFFGFEANFTDFLDDFPVISNIQRGFSYSTNLKLVSFNEWNYTIFWQFYYCLSISRLGSLYRLKCEKRCNLRTRHCLLQRQKTCFLNSFFRQNGDETIQNIDFSIDLIM